MFADFVPGALRLLPPSISLETLKILADSSLSTDAPVRFLGLPVMQIHCDSRMLHFGCRGRIARAKER